MKIMHGFIYLLKLIKPNMLIVIWFCFPVASADGVADVPTGFVASVPNISCLLKSDLLTAYCCIEQKI